MYSSGPDAFNYVFKIRQDDDVLEYLRVAFRDDRVALSAEGGYLHCVSATGITDAMAYGKAGVEGLRADLAIEVKVSESTLLRLGGGYTRVVLVFAGEGRLAHSLDGDEARDVGGARDDYLGGYLLFGFLL